MPPFTKNFKAGMPLFHEKDHSRELYLIQSGSVKVFRMIGNREIELARVGAGSVLGEMALIDGKPRSASAKATEDCAVTIIDADSVYEKIKGVPPWFLSIIKMISQKVRKANDRLRRSCASNRAAGIILALSHMCDAHGGTATLDLDATKRECIQLLGVTHQQIVTILNFLGSHDFIALDEKTVRCVNRQKLEHYCIFLRYLARKAYESPPPLSEELHAVISHVCDSVPQLLDGGQKKYEMDGSEFGRMLSAAHLSDKAVAIVKTLEKLRFLTKSPRAQEGGSEDDPLAGIALYLESSMWARFYVYNQFKDCIPSV